MTNPTRDEILDAHKALEELKNAALKSAEFCGDTEAHLWRTQEILTALPPIPRPNMAEVEWDDELHYLAEAEHSKYGNVIMVSKTRDTGEIYYLRWGSTGRLMVLAAPADLTPTGRRYVLQDEE